MFVHAKIGAAIGLVWVVLRYWYFCRYRESGKGITNFTIPAYMCLNAYAVGILWKVAASFLG